jgi:hypothetical protein
MTELPPRVTGVRIRQERTVELDFNDGTTRVVDLKPYLWGSVFERIANDDEEFARIIVDERLGTIAWPNGADLDPDVLYGAETPASSSAAPAG